MTGIPACTGWRRAAPRSRSKSGRCHPEGLGEILLKEPAGLSIGKVSLESGEEVLGVLAEPILCAGQREITEHGGWRAYIAARG